MVWMCNFLQLPLFQRRGTTGYSCFIASRNRVFRKLEAVLLCTVMLHFQHSRALGNQGWDEREQRNFIYSSNPEFQ